ncbi:hypothetical protein F0562_008552 [Nyssa sinensis]|uniref:DUF4220 domain-containing protein n=1 Tax=Nyssa sinensis TaxID=561372 RepID=A0A5J5A556_9ASTE|nr:hypothetical protein F0562_008552 [Nyssa sinensis]
MADSSYPESMQRLWNAWNVEVMVIWSLLLQIVLVALGSRRKYINGIWIQIILWSAYSMAAWVATIALGKLSQLATQGNSNSSIIDPNNALKALWAPLLLLHLGGSDTITAYSTEDAELWYRQLLELVVQVTIAFYIFARCWTGSSLSILTLFMFVSGIIKYSERTRALRYAADENPKKILISDQDYEDIKIQESPNADLILQSYHLFQFYKHYIADYVAYISEDESAILDDLIDQHHHLFKTMQLELDFMYDVLYTKAPIIYTMPGCILRAISVICMVIVLVGFSIVAKNDYSDADVLTTYLLLVVGVVLEVYAVALLINSNWGILWMIKHCKNHLVEQILRTLAKKSVNKWKMWSNSVEQFNLLKFCLYEEDSRTMILLSRILKVLVYELMETTEILSGVLEVSSNSSPPKEEKREEMPAFQIHKHFNSRGVVALRKHYCEDDLQWSIEKDFDESIIIWHIATNICYHVLDRDDGDDKNTKETSKLVSQYMMHLLVNNPHMLHVTAANFMLEGTCKDLVNNVIKKQGSSFRPDDPRTLLYAENTLRPMPKSVLKDSLKLTRALIDKSLVTPWKIINSVWIEMLWYASNQ